MLLGGAALTLAWRCCADQQVSRRSTKQLRSSVAAGQQSQPSNVLPCPPRPQTFGSSCRLPRRVLAVLRGSSATGLDRSPLPLPSSTTTTTTAASAPSNNIKRCHPPASAVAAGRKPVVVVVVRQLTTTTMCGCTKRLHLVCIHNRTFHLDWRHRHLGHRFGQDRRQHLIPVGMALEEAARERLLLL